MITKKKDFNEIELRLDHIEANINKVVSMLRDQNKRTINKPFVNQFETEVKSEYDKLAKRKYPIKFTNFLNGRYRTIEEICNHLNITVNTARTYLKLARKDGIEFNKRKSNETLSYKVRKI